MSRRCLRIVAVGDLCFNGRYHTLLAKYGVGYPFAAVAPHWREADLRLGNFESPLTNAPRAAPAKCTLRGAAQSIESMHWARFDCVSLANNHAMDYGPEGLLETCRRLKEGELPYVGAGECLEEAASGIVLLRDGVRIGLLAFCDVEQGSPLYAGATNPGVAPLERNSSVDRVRALRPKVDWLIVQLHWGTEMSQLPSPEQRSLAIDFVHAGADLILGHHPHVLQPFETIDGAPVVYSLGNFVFSGMYWRGVNAQSDHFCSRLRLHPLSRQTGWLDVELSRDAPPQVRFVSALLRQDLVVVPRQHSIMSNLNAMLNLRADNYSAEYQREYKRAQARTKWRWAWKPIHRRIEMYLFHYGLLPGAVEGT